MNILETSREKITLNDTHPFEVTNVNFEGWKPKLDAVPERLTLIEDLKEVQVGPHADQVTKI